MTELVTLGTPMLAIELSQRSGGVALVRKGVEPLTVSITGGRRERDELLPAIRSVLESARVQVGDLATVAVDTGPGGFTGLRISIAAGQMLAEVSGAMVVGVPGAEVAAASTSSIRDGDRTGTILVVAATRNGTAWVTRLHRTDPDRDWRPVGTAELLEDPPDERFEVVLADAHLEPEWRAFFTASGIEIIDPIHSPGGFAGLLARSLDEVMPASWFVSSDPATLLPLYPREPEAVRLWKQRACR